MADLPSSKLEPRRIVSISPTSCSRWLASAVLVILSGCLWPGAARDLTELEARLEWLRQKWNIPGMSAAIARHGEVMWTRGFGFAEVEERQPAGPDTGYHIASLTKTFAAAVLLQLVEEGKLDLEDPVSKYGVEVKSSGEVRVKHLLSHTSGGVPGTSYNYSGKRFGALSQVIARSSGRSFGELLVERVLRPLRLERTAPNPEDGAVFALAGVDREDFLRRLAPGYDSDGRTLVAYPKYFGASAGLVSTAPDLARYSIAILEGKLLRPESWALAFSPTVSLAGAKLPYGLGWFVQEHRGVKLLWHYGLWTGNSAMIILVPDRRLAFVALANSDRLTRKFDLGDGDLLRSPFAREVVEAFLLGGI